MTSTMTTITTTIFHFLSFFLTPSPRALFNFQSSSSEGESGSEAISRNDISTISSRLSYNAICGLTYELTEISLKMEIGRIELRLCHNHKKGFDRFIMGRSMRLNEWALIGFSLFIHHSFWVSVQISHQDFFKKKKLKKLERK